MGGGRATREEGGYVPTSPFSSTSDAGKFGGSARGCVYQGGIDKKRRWQRTQFDTKARAANNDFL